MLDENEKKEMLADGLSAERSAEFRAGSRNKSKTRLDLDGYIAFLMDVQMVKSFEHKPVITRTIKNIF